jgi:hypothetical protein
MSRTQIPLDHDILWATGDLVLRAFLELELKDDQGNWHRKTFRVDSATDMTTMPAREARLLGLPLPAFANPGVTHEQTGLEIRSGFLRCRVVGMDPTEYAFPCFFLGDPDSALSLNAPLALLPRRLLGLSGVVDKIRWILDGTPAGLPAPHGYLTVEKT